MKPIVLYYNPRSRARTVHWMLEELGVPYRLELLDFEKREHKTEQYLAMNPMGKVPTIVDNDVVVTEAAAICAYLADNYPRALLAPALHDPARASYLRWLFFAAGCVEPALADRRLGRPVPDKPASLGYGTYEDVVRTLETAISPGPFVLGERFSAADVCIGSSIGWGLMTMSLEPRPTFEAYLGRVTARPAFKRCNERARVLADQMASG